MGLRLQNTCRRRSALGHRRRPVRQAVRQQRIAVSDFLCVSPDVVTMSANPTAALIKPAARVGAMIAATQAGDEMFLFASGIHGCAFRMSKSKWSVG